MENYDEWIFVRCWNNAADFVENEWKGYVMQSDKDSQFFEIEMKFHIMGEPGESNNHFSTDHFKKFNLIAAQNCDYPSTILLFCYLISGLYFSPRVL